MSYDTAGHPPRARAARFRWSTLWAGAVATSVVAALIALAGEFVVETLLEVDLLPPQGGSVLGWSHHVSYPAAAALLALVAAAVLSLLLLGVPRPLTFFGWVMSLVTVIVGVVPFGSDEETSTQIATCLIAVLVVCATWSLLVASARRAATRPDVF